MVKAIKWFALFFEVNGIPAMRNLTVFITIMVTSVGIIYMTMLNTITDTIFASYLLAGGGVYAFGKLRDSKENIAETEQNKPAPTVISDNTKVETVSGDINIKPKRKK